ncbi:MAG: hypothetical protein Gaeavirus18_6 [Gaeavirus sp.]|uniref:Uncharacterized protein n=1 Tax=Gaeavirus sp. TaxID=2487767 RepID=A0A3G5A438_9VIRU|nr:MAG: hypothetical protein Gaeavirus18_6 [Gaeavirus sp.]
MTQDQAQTPEDYKEYFSNRFTNLFQNFVSACIHKVNDNDTKNDLNKIAQLFDKLNYEKIITKLCLNDKLHQGLAFIVKNDFDKQVMTQIFESDDKTFMLMPSMHINKIFLNSDIPTCRELYDIFHSMNVCAFTYTKVLESIQKSISDANNTDPSTFNPFSAVGSVSEDLDIDTMYNGVEYKSMSAVEMVMGSILNKQMDGKMNNIMNDIKDDDVNQAATKLSGILNSKAFNGDKQTTEILNNMLSKIQTEVINLKNEPAETTQGKKGVEQLLGIAQKVAGDMMKNIKDQKIDVLQLWDTTSSLAKSTTNSTALNMVDKLIRSNIIKTQQQQQQQHHASVPQTQPPEVPTTTTEESSIRQRRPRKPKN